MLKGCDLMNTEVSRRNLLIGGGLGMAAMGLSAPAAQAKQYATVVLSPHQDDETLRLSGYVTYAADRGDDLALYSVTDGSSTSLRTRLGWTRERMTQVRDREQANAWGYLTNWRPDTPIYRLTKNGRRIQDGAASRVDIRNAVRSQLSKMTGQHELYVATWHHDRDGTYAPSPTAGDLHPDHIACILAARDLSAEGVIVRYARHPFYTHISGTASYAPTDSQFRRVRSAVDSYKEIGQRSVPAQFKKLIETRGKSVITR